MNNQNQICQTCYQRIDGSKVEPGEGYRLLTVGERRKADDEFFVKGRGWKPYPYDHGKIFDGVEYFIPRRRKLEIPVDPGAGYRLLAVGEIRQVGDEFFYSGKWDGPTEDVGTPVFNHSWPYRRKIGPKQYRLLVVGEILKSTDELWVWPVLSRIGFWKPNGGCGFSVVTTAYPPIRREINSYIGGPA